MLPSPLQLDGYYLKEARFESISPLENLPEKSVDSGRVNLDITHKAEQDARDPYKWRCEVTVRTKQPSRSKPPYSFVVTYVGFFEVDPRYPLEKVALLAKTNGPAVLYSAARETIITLASRSPYPISILPLVTFLPLDKKGIAKRPTRKALGA
ncbi:MAG: hypothetical protein DMF61_15870 [Blastocatellia bacterium AA13]|nr:MAG: hypothetical protein DMF61_15870 [Blastocatellia bacterium AA13]